MLEWTGEGSRTEAAKLLFLYSDSEMRGEEMTVPSEAIKQQSATPVRILAATFDRKEDGRGGCSGNLLSFFFFFFDLVAHTQGRGGQQKK